MFHHPWSYLVVVLSQPLACKVTPQQLKQTCEITPGPFLKVAPLNAQNSKKKNVPQNWRISLAPAKNLKHLFLFRRKKRWVWVVTSLPLETHKTTSAPPHQHRCTWSLTLRTLKGTLPDTNTSFVFTGEENVCFFGSYHRMSGNLRSLGPNLSKGYILYLLIQRFTCVFLCGSDSLG